MARGERQFSIADQQVKRFSNEPIPNKEWRFILDTKGVTIKKPKDETKAVPYISGIRLRALGSAKEEGQKDRLVFHSLFISLVPGKDGVLMMNRGGGLVEFCKALGRADKNFSERDYQTSEGEVQAGLDAKEILDFVKSVDGMELGGRTKTEKNPKGEMESKVDYFIEAEPQPDSQDDAAESTEEEVDATEDENTEEEEAPPPPPKKSAKPTAKGKR